MRKWRNLAEHRAAQAKGRGGIFSGYRLRVANVLRDYSHAERGQAPRDSVEIPRLSPGASRSVRT